MDERSGKPLLNISSPVWMTQCIHSKRTMIKFRLVNEHSLENKIRGWETFWTRGSALDNRQEVVSQISRIAKRMQEQQRYFKYIIDDIKLVTEASV